MTNDQKPQNPRAPHMTATTEVYSPDSGKCEPVKIGQPDEGIKTLNREQFRMAAKVQAEKDSELEALAAQSTTSSPPTPPNPVAQQRANPTNPVAPSIAEPKVLRAPAAEPPSGKASPAPRKRSGPKRRRQVAAKQDTPVPNGSLRELRENQDKLEARVEALSADTNAKIDGVVHLLHEMIQTTANAQPPAAMREEKEEPFVQGMTDASTALDVAGADPRSVSEVLGDDEYGNEEEQEEWAEKSTREIVEKALVPVESQPADRTTEAVGRMQAFMKRKNPLKDFRRFWATVCPRAGFLEWPKEMQEKFTETFSTVVLHPRFLYQVRTCVDTFQNGQVVGEEQMYKMLVVMAGSCALYQIITTPDPANPDCAGFWGG